MFCCMARWNTASSYSGGALTIPADSTSTEKRASMPSVACDQTKTDWDVSDSSPARGSKKNSEPFETLASRDRRAAPSALPTHPHADPHAVQSVRGAHRAPGRVCPQRAQRAGRTCQVGARAQRAHICRLQHAESGPRHARHAHATRRSSAGPGTKMPRAGGIDLDATRPCRFAPRLPLSPSTAWFRLGNCSRDKRGKSEPSSLERRSHACCGVRRGKHTHTHTHVCVAGWLRPGGRTAPRTSSRSR